MAGKNTTIHGPYPAHWIADKPLTDGAKHDLQKALGRDLTEREIFIIESRCSEIIDHRKTVIEMPDHQSVKRTITYIATCDDPIQAERNADGQTQAWMATALNRMGFGQVAADVDADTLRKAAQLALEILPAGKRGRPKLNYQYQAVQFAIESWQAWSQQTRQGDMSVWRDSGDDARKYKKPDSKRASWLLLWTSAIISFIDNKPLHFSQIEALINEALRGKFISGQFRLPHL